jgi:hypothetical protein
MGVQSDSLSSKTSGKRSSSDTKLVARSSSLEPLSDDRRGQEGYAHEAWVLDSLDEVGETE